MNHNKITSPRTRLLCYQPWGVLFIARFNQKRLLFLILEAYIVKPDVETTVY